MRNNSAEILFGNADGVFRAREIRRLEPQDRCDTEAVNSVIGVPWRMTDGKWTMDRPEVRVERLDAQVAMQSKTTKEHKHTLIAAERESKNA